jgi:4-hydroxyphenylpyruvate dioxygenase
VERLRRHGILYDRDEHGGELFHLYTPVYGDRVFFEVLHRRGGYDGFGSTNAPVRMAAHRHQRLDRLHRSERSGRRARRA